MKKSVLSIILTLCLILTTFISVPVYAAGGVTLNKTTFTAGEKGQATVTGLTDEQIEAGAYLAIELKGTKVENATNQIYVADLPSGNVWEFAAPNNLGTYELMLLDVDSKLISKAELTVGAPKAQSGDIALSKSEARLNDPMSVAIKGLTNEQIANGAWLGLSKSDEKMENTVVGTYIQDLPTNNTYEFKAPDKFGKYQIRVFSDSNFGNDASFYGMAEFTVVSSKAKTGDIVLSKASVRPEEKMSVAVKGLTKGEIEAGAWLGIVRSDEKLENTTADAYIGDLPVNNTFEFIAPYEPGTYEVRVFCSNPMEPEEYQYGMFGVAQFIVSGAANEGLYAGYEGLSTWAVTEVNNAKAENLVTDKVMTDFRGEITREEFCELAVLLYEKMTGTKTAAPSANPFSDTDNSEILKAYNLKIVGGVGQGKFAPDNKVTRQEIAAMLVRTLKAVKPNAVVAAQYKSKFQDEKEVASWAKDPVKFMNANGVLNGSTLSDGTSYILPKGNTTREQAISMVLRVYNAFK